MRAFLIALCLLPTLAVAEIPLQGLPLHDVLLKPDGTPIASVKKVVVDADRQIAVLDASTNIIHIYQSRWLGFPQWFHAAQLNLPGGEFGPINDFDLQGTTLVYSRTSVPADSYIYPLYVVQASDDTWQSFAAERIGATAGPVQIDGDWIGASVPQGVRMYQRTPGNWADRGILSQVGVTRVPSGPGPLFALDANRVLIGTNLLVLDPNGPYEYVVGAGILYEFGSSGIWTEKTRLTTDRTNFNGRTADRIHVSLKADQASVAGRVFRGPHGFWEQTADLSPQTSSPASGTRFEILSNQLAVMPAFSPEDQDLYRLGADDLWHPYLRLPVEQETGLRILATDRQVGVMQIVDNGPGLLTVFYVSELQAPQRTASIIGAEIDAAGAAAGNILGFTVSAWVPDGARITAIYASAAPGNNWQLLSPVPDGNYDEAFETVKGFIPIVTSAENQNRVNVRVFDNFGRVTEMLGTIDEPGPVVEILPSIIGAETTPPRVSEVMMASPRIAFGHSNVVYAFATDYPSGVIRGIQFRIDDGVWRTLEPFPDFDGPFQFSSAWEAGKGLLPPANEPGHHRVWVRAVDAAGNVSAPQSTTFEVLPPP